MLKNHIISSIIFDLGGVYFTDGTKSAINEISAQYQINEQLVFDVFRGKIGIEYRKGNITREEFCALALNYWNTSNISATKISDIWLSGYQQIQGTVEIIRQLNKKGYKVFYLSGNAPDRVEYLESKYHFLADFDGGLFSYKTKISKTDIELYKMMVAEINNKAENCIYIDDKHEILLIAEQIGLNTIHYTTAEHLRKRLVDFNIIL